MHEILFQTDSAIKNVLTASLVAANLPFHVYEGTDDVTPDSDDANAMPFVVVNSVSCVETGVKTEYFTIHTAVYMELQPQDYTANAITLRQTLLNTLRASTIEADLMAANPSIHVDQVDTSNWQREISGNLWRFSAMLEISARLV